MPNSDITKLDLIIYGGAFDPPHLGHRGCAQAVLSACPNAELWIVPGAMPAGAAGAHKEPRASFEQRVAMCHSNFEGLETKISEIEKNMPAPNFTARTLNKLREQFPNKRLGFVIGSDQLENFHRWHAPKQVLELATAVVIKRDFPDAPATSVQKMLDSLTTKMPTLDKSRFIILDAKVPPAISSELRACFAGEGPVSKEWLHPHVHDYINKANLYSNIGSTL